MSYVHSSHDDNAIYLSAAVLNSFCFTVSLYRNQVGKAS